jgi:hypothetical protein
MAHQSSASITLPRDFKFSYTSDDENNDKVDMPRTPARPSNPIDSFDLGVPAPPKQTFKLRRRPRDQADTGAMDEAPILPSVEMPSPRLHGSFFTHVHPSIEMTEAPELASFSFSDMSTSDYLAPGDGPLRLLSPPKTPASQVTTYLTESSGAIEWSMFHPFHPYDLHARPTSALSTFSDSSATSHGSSFDSKSSFDAGSCTSPESDVGDPFALNAARKLSTAVGHTTPGSGHPNAKRAKTTRHAHFTREMDDHLWMTYITYVQDPRVTPFKMLPGTAPPLGVCHRVAREAKATWRSHRPSTIPRISIQDADLADSAQLSGPMDESTQTAAACPQTSIALKWPRSEAATRYRLRALSKRKPSLSAHYMRLLRTRSPSPFESSSSVSASSSPAQPLQSAPVVQPPTPQPSNFTSRSLNVSLAEATAPSMQPDGPLAQLQRRTPQPPMAPQQRRGSDWYARIGRSGARAAHQKSQSLQLGLGLGSSSGMQSNSFERGSILASPFDDNEPSRQNFLDNMNKTQSLGRAFLNNPPRLTDAGPELRSPFPLDGPMLSAKSLKRRFGVHEQSSSQQQSLDDVFTAPPTSAQNPMLRNRGFSLSAVPGMGYNTHLPPKFQAATAAAPLDDHKMGEASDRLQPPQSTIPPRLGSPFSGAASNSRFNTFPRRFTPREAGLSEQPFDS